MKLWIDYSTKINCFFRLYGVHLNGSNGRSFSIYLLVLIWSNVHYSHMLFQWFKLSFIYSFQVKLLCQCFYYLSLSATILSSLHDFFFIYILVHLFMFLVLLSSSIQSVADLLLLQICVDIHVEQSILYSYGCRSCSFYCWLFYCLVSSLIVIT